MVSAPVSTGMSVVLNGQFAPWTFRPDFLAREGFLTPEEADGAINPILSAEFVQFKLSWVMLTAELQRLSIATIEEPYIRIHDLVLSYLTLMPLTPVLHVGINRNAHFLCSGTREWHEIGDRLAPKGPWGEFAEGEGVTKSGLRSMTFERPRDPKSELPGRTRVTIEPSMVHNPGIYIDVNDHYDIVDGGLPGSSARAMELIQRRWEVSEATLSQIAHKVLGA
ncbi:hypothetical protein [Acidisphaera sp. L21]|uniref:hypothetical protein n=1 Tax=Acidisphaera sp. L21 TaxID=1641851 RepID=UPI00131C8768|nr:hypothetical protein [Acidisphaera sp. L21]